MWTICKQSLWPRHNRNFWMGNRMWRGGMIYRGWGLCRAGWMCRVGRMYRGSRMYWGGRTYRGGRTHRARGSICRWSPCEEEEGLAEANDSNKGPKDLIGVLVTTLIISAKPSSYFTIPSLCCWIPSLILFNPFNTDFLTPSSIFSVSSPNPIWYSASCHSSSITKPTSSSSVSCTSTLSCKK